MIISALDVIELRGYQYEESEVIIEDTYIYIYNKDLLVVSHGDDVYDQKVIKKFPKTK